jgi:hypothetical protein
MFACPLLKPEHGLQAFACALSADLFIDRYVINPHPFPPYQSGERAVGRA